ncbi:hypothetical protein BDP27DRAFT_1317108 [Rhodocollybia butyracea]|uniref:Uncharacterized protein n=1 Tax=Rhodocollybia butyracea TaxID=206335 RepID=A0A9P5UCS5_9AGAR|nr:hypothetical protein BDP27DRAFT_1317108 [Rhodocollybia butyracea]
MDYLRPDPASAVSTPDYMRHPQVPPFPASSSSSLDFETQLLERSFNQDFDASNPHPGFYGEPHFTQYDPSRTPYQNSLQPYESIVSDGLHSEHVPRDDMQYSSLYLDAQGDLQSDPLNGQFGSTFASTMYTNSDQSGQVFDPSDLLTWDPMQLLANF